ncbi:BTB/POZ and MATH domain-containing protein 1-like [Hordeum vulgare subsp. vulgare]|uniref:BTB domain-containing protein n=1 Tax=Hordeum vulgare subsp. vulgare TaxID=112509 RepID=A0A8I6XIZ1_HORVV|nr:BTB/POZ and MATH domain-containing protein 1-like [Hordeum vulgare subsp. vulgare]
MTRRCPWKKRTTPPPASRKPTSFVRAEHEFHIVGYKADARAALAYNANYSILSGAFEVGGHTWALECSFHNNDDDEHLTSITLLLLTPYTTQDAVVAKARLRIEDPLGNWPAAVWESDGTYTFHVWSGNTWLLSQSQAGRSWTLPVPDAFRGHESRYVQDDRLVILCTVEVLREEDSGVAKDMHKLLLLSSEPKSTSTPTPAPASPCMLPEPDVTFVVEQAEIQAHRLILAMRSPVFAAELLGEMREGTTRRVMVDDMSASTFRAMIRFIYTDELRIKGKTPATKKVVGCKEKRAAMRRLAMALDLLVAADRYDIEKLRLMCEKTLSESIDTTSVMPTLMAVHGRHTCRQLEASCIDYLASDANVYANVKATEEYKELEESCCSFLADVTDKVATTCILADNHAGDTTSVRRPEKRTASTYNTSELAHSIHELRIPNIESLQTSSGAKQRFSSDTFRIGGHDWKLDASVKEGKISVFATLLTDPGKAGVRALVCFMLDDPGGETTLIIGPFEDTFTSQGASYGYVDCTSVKDAVSSYMLPHDGSLTIRCEFILTTKARTGGTSGSDTSAGAGDDAPDVPPPPNVAYHLEQLLMSRKGSDVTFLVEKEEIHAHSLVIAARCPALYMMVVDSNQKKEHVVAVWYMRVGVFKAVLHFIYTDELPPLEDIAVAAGHDVTTIAYGVLDAAARFHLDGMKDKCEALIGVCVSQQNVLAMIRLAGHHDRKKLQDYCMKFK